uniref:Ribosomal protein L1 n=1 Tax=Jakoba bahamiensis TaxID=221721 RepID=M4Q9P7_9EUKA|nr:ribosomal protein L1 [Jakoba bahamiensis]AGH24142.1 ribosomal protein L1 [Jakoba bahamiensis]
MSIIYTHDLQDSLKALRSYNICSINSSFDDNPIVLTISYNFKTKLQKKKKEDKSFLSSLRSERIVYPHFFGKKPVLGIYDSSYPADSIQIENTHIYGSLELINQIIAGTLSVDFLICRQSDFHLLKKYSKQLGPKKLMPSLKNGTLVQDLDEGIRIVGQCSTSIHTNNHNVLYIQVGSSSMKDEDILENIQFLNEWISKRFPITYQRNSMEHVGLQLLFGPSIFIK